MNDISLHILDIVQNSISAGALYIEIFLFEDIENDLSTLIIKDNGKGMTQEQTERICDPFFTSRTTRRVGMGLPLLKQSAEQCGGILSVTSKVGKGTEVKATFGYSNIDRPPLGDIGNAVILLVSANISIRFKFTYKYKSKEYVFDTLEINNILEGVPLNNPSVIKYLNEMIDENINELRKC